MPHQPAPDSSTPVISDAVIQRAHELFFHRVLPARSLFAPGSQHLHRGFAPVIAPLAELAAQGRQDLDPVLEARVSDIARSHRRLGFPPQTYETFTHCLSTALTEVADLDPKLRTNLTALFTQLGTVMAQAAAAADLAGIPPAHSARVVAAHRPNRLTTVVRLELSMPVEWPAGHAPLLTTAHTPGQWRQLYPAAPPGPTGQLEFHIARVDTISSLLGSAKPGDIWTLGEAEATALSPLLLPLSQQRDHDTPQLTIIGCGTGWAAARAAVLAGIDQGRASHAIHAIHVVPSPGYAYDTQFQANYQRLAGGGVDIIARQDSDPPLLAPTAQAIAPTIHSEPAAVAVATGAQHYAVVGPRAQVLSVRSGLLAYRVPAADITVIPF